jgi:hypothetical protein
VTSVTELPASERPPGRLIQYVDTAVRPGRPQYYRVVAEDAGGNRSPASERLVVRLPKTQPPAPPDWSPPTVTPGSVELSWAAEEDLRCLVLRRADGMLWRPLGPWAASGDYALTDTGLVPGTLYEYRVRVRDSVGHIVDGPPLPVTAI